LKPSFFSLLTGHSFLIVLIGIAGCDLRNEVVTNANLADGEFSATIQPIFHRNCGGTSCHGGGPRGFAGGVDLTSYEGIFRGSRFGTIVVSGSPFMSHLLQAINRNDTTLSPISSVAMPAGRDPLPEEDIRTIASWIERGARNDAGRLPFPEPRPLGKVYFTSQSVDLVGVLDLQTNLIMRYVTAGNSLPFNAPPQAPHNVQIDDQGRYYYVTLISGNLLKKFDAATNQMVGQTGVGTAPAHVVVTPDGATAYVTNFDQAVGRVYVVETATMQVRKVITAPPLMKATHGARLSHDGKYLYIGSNGNDLLHVILAENDSVIAHIPVAPDVPPIGSFRHKPYQIAVRGDDRFLYVTLNGTNQVSVIERTGDTFTFVRTIEVGTRPLQCEATPDQRFVYICNQGSGSVSVIDAQSNTALTTIEGVGPQPHGIDVTSDSRLVYITCENSGAGVPPHHPLVGSKDPGFVAVIDVGTQTIINSIEVGGFAAGVSITPGKGN
jgi:YVTN family beta-propeller protein